MAFLFHLVKLHRLWDLKGFHILHVLARLPLYSPPWRCEHNKAVLSHPWNKTYLERSWRDATCDFGAIVIIAADPHMSYMNRTRLRQLIWRLATQIYRNCHRTWLRQHNWWNGDVSNFPTLAKSIQQRREVHRIGQQNSISAFLHLLNLMYGGVNQRFPSNGSLIERGSPKIEI